jgi:hypothetical protein
VVRVCAVVQVWGLRPWLAAFLRRAFFLRRRFDDMSTPLLVRSFLVAAPGRLLRARVQGRARERLGAPPHGGSDRAAGPNRGRPAGRSRREQRGVTGELTSCAERVRVRNVFARVGVASTGRR